MAPAVLLRQLLSRYTRRSQPLEQKLHEMPTITATTSVKPSHARPRLSRRKRRMFIVVSLLFPLIVLLVLEGFLRLCGYGGYPTTFRRVGTLEDGSSLIITDNPGPASYFFANKSRPGTLNQSALVMPKPKGTFRIMLAGESAMKGFPQPKALAASAFLEAMLGDVWPDRTVEVINLGTTAVASFPVLGLLTESLNYDPDLCIVYVGNNEFFGAYGVASLHSAGRSTTAIRVIRGFRWLAVAQFIDSLLGGADRTADKTLMEAMMGRSFIAADDPIRMSAANNLGHFTGEMIDRCRARGVPVIVCTLPANERDLAPLGQPDLSRLSEPDRARLASMLASRDLRTLGDAVALDPMNAAAYYALGKAQQVAGDSSAAAGSFQRAMDLDPMPWRPPGMSVDALRTAAKEHGAMLCDLQSAFRAASPGGSIGWELMDDHVHPTLQGQDLVARAIVKTLTTAPGKCEVRPEKFAMLGSFEEYAARLGDNPYDRYGAAHTMRVLGRIPFFKETNPRLLERTETICGNLSAGMPVAVREVLTEWQKPSTHKGEQRPITGMVGRVLIQSREFGKAEGLFKTAASSVSQYSSWNIEFTYFMLVCRERVRGKLDSDDHAIALAAIKRGEFLLGQGRSVEGQAERFVGRLYQLRKEYERAIPFLLTAREKLGGTDLVALDQALVESYMQTKNSDKARTLIDNGIQKSGQYADLYRRMMSMLTPQIPAASPLAPATPPQP